MTQAAVTEQYSLFEPVKWYAGELAVWRRHEKLPPSQWAEKYRVVTKSSRPGPWRNEVTPYLVEVMDTWAQPWVREVVFCAAPQTGKTECMFNCLAWQSERCSDDALVVMPGEKTVRRQSQDRLLPMFEASERLAALKTDDGDDASIYRLRLRNGRTIYLAWASSPQMLASVPIRDLYFDEVDKYPPFAGREADPLSLGEVRQRTYPHLYKRLKISTPTITQGPIWPALNGCVEIRDYWVPCPHCGLMQRMTWDGIVFPADERDPRQVKQLKLARYRCEGCNAEWDDAGRDRAVKGGQWLPRGEPVLRPVSVGFHLPSWYSPFVSLSEVVADFLAGQKDRGKLMHWCNAHCAEPWSDDEAEPLDPLAIMARLEEFGARLPAAAGVITAAVDVQLDRLELEVVAWGEGEESWSLDYRQIYGDPGRRAVWKELDALLLRTWEHPAGVKMGIKAACIDSGYRTKEVYEFVRRRFHRGIYATKGQSTPGKALVGKPTKQQALKGRPVLVFPVGTDTAKDTLFGRLEIEEPGPGYCHFPREREREYFEQFAAERPVTRYRRGQPYRVWEKVSGGARNEAIDLRVLNMVALAIVNPQWGAIMGKLRVEAGGQGKDEQKKTTAAPVPEAELAKKLRQVHRAKVRGPKRKKGFVNAWK